MPTPRQLKRAGEAAMGVNDALGEGTFWVVLSESDPEAAHIARTQAELDTLVDDLESAGESPVVIPVEKDASRTAKRSFGPITVTVQEPPRQPGGPTPAPMVFSAGDRGEFGDDWIDAAFFSLAAIDKFAMPYYTALHGAEAAAQMRDRYLAAEQETAVHFPPTLWWPSHP